MYDARRARCQSIPSQFECPSTSILRSLAKLWLLITAVLLIVSGAAYGSGFSLFEQGAKATAMGGAFAATADDPTAIFYNVAGIAQQRKAAFMVGGTTINFSNEFTGDPND